MRFCARRVWTVITAFACIFSAVVITSTRDALAQSNHTFGSENVVKGASVSSANRDTEDAAYNSLVEGDQYTDTNFSGSSENVVVGSAGGDSFPTALDTDDASRRSYTEAEVGGGSPTYEIIRPDGDGVVQTWTPNGESSNYLCVDESTAGGDSDTTYVSGLTGAETDYYTLGDISDPGSVNIDVTIWVIGRDLGGTSNLAGGFVISSTLYEGFSVDPDSSYTNYSYEFTENPDTSSEWTYSEVNGLVAYIYAGDTNPDVYVTQVGVLIEETASGSYQLDAQITFSSVGDSAQTTGWQVLLQGYRSGSEDFGVYAWDFVAEDWVLEATVQAGSDTDYDFSLPADEYDGDGDQVKIRIIGLTETGDSTQDTVYFDVLKVNRINEGYALDIDMTASSVPAHGNITLRIKGYTSAESFKVSVWNYTSAGWDADKMTITSLSNAWQTTLDLCDDHHRSGTEAKIRWTDATAEAGDTTKDTFYLDVAWISRYYTDPTFTDYRSGNIEIDEGQNVIVWGTYTDYDDQAPSYVRVHVDVSYYAMDANDSDTDYYDGKLYGKTITGLLEGVWDYWYAIKDAESGEVTTTPTYTITVNAPSNNAPYFTSTPTATGHNNTLYYYDANAEDADEDPLTFDLEGNGTAFLSITPSTGVIQGTPTELGDYWMNVSVTDGTDTVWQNTSIHIYTDNPSFISSAITEWQHGTTYSYNAQATDPEAEGLSFNLEGNGSAFLDITPAGYYCLVSGPVSTMGWWYVNLSVSDGTNTVWQNYTLTALNQAPYIYTTPITSIEVNESYSYAPNATDNNSDEFTIALVDAPEWLDFNESTGYLEGTPTVNGTYFVNLSVTDVLGAVGYQNFSIDVDLSNADNVSLLAFILAMFFCLVLLAVGFKEKTFWLLAGPVWIISGIVVFYDYGAVFMLAGVAMGMVLLIKGAYDVYT